MKSLGCGWSLVAFFALTDNMEGLCPCHLGELKIQLAGVLLEKKATTHCLLIFSVHVNGLNSLLYKCLDGQTSTRCSRRCTGCLLNSASTISWPCWRSRFSRRHLRSIWTSTSRCSPAHATLDRRPSHCCACHFDGHHLPDDRSALSHLWLGTHCHLPY